MSKEYEARGFAAGIAAAAALTRGWAEHCNSAGASEWAEDYRDTADRIRALTPADSEFVGVRREDLDSLLESITAREDETRNQTWAWKMATRIRAALESTDG